MKRAILELYRDAAAAEAGRAGALLGNIKAPALVIWGDKDPYTQPRLGDYYKRALGGDVRVEHLPDAGHWPWLDRPEVIDKTVAFLTAELEARPGR